MTTTQHASVSRRSFLGHTAAGTAALTLAAGGLPHAAAAATTAGTDATSGADLKPRPALPSILAATERFLLVAPTPAMSCRSWRNAMRITPPWWSGRWCARGAGRC